MSMDENELQRAIVAFLRIAHSHVDTATGIDIGDRIVRAMEDPEVRDALERTDDRGRVRLILSPDATSRYILDEDPSDEELRAWLIQWGRDVVRGAERRELAEREHTPVRMPLPKHQTIQIGKFRGTHPLTTRSKTPKYDPRTGKPLLDDQGKVIYELIPAHGERVMGGARFPRPTDSRRSKLPVPGETLRPLSASQKAKARKRDREERLKLCICSHPYRDHRNEACTRCRCSKYTHIPKHK